MKRKYKSEEKGDFDSDIEDYKDAGSDDQAQKTDKRKQEVDFDQVWPVPDMKFKIKRSKNNKWLKRREMML